VKGVDHSSFTSAVAEEFVATFGGEEDATVCNRVKRALLSTHQKNMLMRLPHGQIVDDRILGTNIDVKKVYDELQVSRTERAGPSLLFSN
jgi:hypothetical protein